MTAPHPPGLAIVVNQSCQLLPGIPTHLQQIADDNAFVRLGERQVFKGDEDPLNPLITLILGAQHREGDRLGPRQEIFQLLNSLEGLNIHEGFHPPIMNDLHPDFRLISC